MAIDSDSDTERSLSAESTVEESPKQHQKRRKIKHLSASSSLGNMSNDTKDQVFNGQHIKDTKYPTLPPKSTKLYNENSEELYCICRKPDYGELMVGCDGCDDWYHFKCMKINMQYRELIANYYCPYCEIDGKGVTLWKRKCRLKNCHKPILENASKYCSKEHGLEYLSNLLNVQLKNQQEHHAGVLNRDQVGDMVRISGNIEDFKSLGDKLPEIPNADVTKDSRVVNLDDSIKILKEEKEFNFNKKKVLLKSRENIKKFNEVFTAADQSTTTSNKKKVKKVDLCGYDLIFNDDKFENNKFDETELVSNDIEHLTNKYNEFIENETNDTTFCFLDRRKCLKHNGWMAVINDDIDLNLRQINKKLQANTEKREKVIKTIKTDFFERKL